MKKINAKIGNSGIAIGKLFTISSYSIPEKSPAEDQDAELLALDNAVNTARESYKCRLEQVTNSGDTKTAEILSAQLMFFDDEELITSMRDIIKTEKCRAPFAAYEGAEKIACGLEKLEDEYLRTRSEDVRGIGRKISDAARGIKSDTQLTEDSVVYASELLPEEIIGFNKDYLKGIITLKGSAVSHTAILAGTYGIPYLFGTDISEENGMVIIDGESGLIITQPDENTLKEYKEKLSHLEAEAYDTSVKLPVKLYANIAGPADIEFVKKNGGEGVGLFRTEFLYMNRATLPSEDEQFKVYKEVVEKMQPREVIIRTMDIGTDKKTECLPLDAEENPALGKRAIRICFENTELFRTQLRALLRAAVYGNLKIMYPMIASAWELDEIDKQVKKAACELDERKEKYTVPSQGIMIETPAAAICSDELAKKADFFSIGTNDLTQYTLAADRLASGMDKYFDTQHEAIFRLIKLCADNAHACGKTVGICGELGGNPAAIPRLIDCGVDELSMSPGKIKTARKAVYDYVNRPDYSNNESLTSPCDGRLIEMKDIPDKAFSQGALGNCIAVDPDDDGTIYSPCSGEITMVAETLHAIGIRSEGGSDILIHAGIDTVMLKGEGFDCKVKVGQKVSAGDIILIEDTKLIRSRGLSAMVILCY